MATWEDGPEYAPLERPDGFSLPTAQPLEVVAPEQQPAALAPKDRPAFDSPPGPVAPLSQLVPAVVDERDPVVPFAVASSTLTSMDSAWGSAHYSQPSGAAAGGAPAALTPGFPAPAFPAAPYPAVATAGPVQGPYGDAGPQAWPAPPATGWPAPPLTSWPSPQAPVPPVSGPAQLPGGYPPPGTAQWFGPGPVAPQYPPPPAALDARAVLTAATPGLLICLGIGAVIYLLAPIMLGVAFALSSRVQVAQQQVRQVFMIALGFLGFFALAGLLTRIWFVDWWHFVGVSALVICWGLLIAVLATVYRALKRRLPPTPRSTSSWG